jgi:hypothetical protein
MTIDAGNGDEKAFGKVGTGGKDHYSIMSPKP